MKNRVAIGIIVFGLITLGLVALMPRYQPKEENVLFHQIDSLRTEIEILEDVNIKQQMQIRFKL
jgi:hypothetical protein